MFRYDFHSQFNVDGLDFLSLGSDWFHVEASFVWSKDVLCSANVRNFDRTVVKNIFAYDPLNRLDGRSTNDALKFSI